ncbi:MAG: hypothetical protein AUK35_05820 [Zetaproteobacteria bacterium CG2_30_46_52]|nr:MAG: hypothetical protein AUK35_05820 [Zetaproteobacteria bacterium CG2_30_46_52]
MKYLQYCLLLLSLFALPACQSALDKQKSEDNTKRAGLHYRLGIDALHRGLLPKAFDELLISDKLDPENSVTLDAIAYAWRLRGNQKEARAYYERAIQYDAGAATYNNYGSLLVEMGEYKLAETHLNKALEDPTYNSQGLAFTNLGDALLGQNRFEDAIAAYRKAHMLAPNWQDPQLREAIAYVRFNRPNYAQALYETILRQDPISQPALSGLITLLKGKGEDVLLKNYIDTFVEQSPDELHKAWAKDELSRLSGQK